MNRIKFLVFLIVISVTASMTVVWLSPAHVCAEPDTRVIGYFISWGVYGRNYQVADIPADKLTHINYAFARISDSGEIALGDPWADIQQPYPGDAPDLPFKGNFNQLLKLKASHPHLKTLIAVGGWTWSEKFSDVTLTQQSRQKFAGSCVEFMKQYGFDGVDIDWEYPVSGGEKPGRPEDKVNYTLLLQELRNRLDAQGAADGKHYLLTICAPAAESNYNNYELDKIPQYVDWIGLMSYDFNGSWSKYTNFNAPLHAHPGDPMGATLNINSTVEDFLARGVSPDKLVMGVPFYGVGWNGVPDINNGLFQPPGGSAGSFDYKDLAQNYIGKGYARHWSNSSKVPWLYNPGNGTMSKLRRSGVAKKQDGVCR